MSERDSTSESGGGHHNIVLTPDEKMVFGQLFQAADSEGIGVVTGELAVKFFEKSGLSPRILGEIWGIADTLNRGLLTRVGFSVALRLIGQAQNGQHPRPELAQHPGPLPRFEGVNIVYPSPPTASSPPLPAIQNQPPAPAGVLRVPPLMPQDVEKFSALFDKSGAVDGVLQGHIARDIFQRSKLPTPTLIQIWNLADRQHRGALGPAEFVVAMHLITCCKNGSLPVLPPILPPGLYEAAAGRPSTRNGPDRRQPGRVMPPVPPIPKQFSGPNAQRAQSPLSRQFTPPISQPAPVQRDTTGGWAINTEDKARFDRVFLTVEKANPAFITGEEAVPFFSNSKLSEEVLAQIWDLADITKSGQLDRDEFAIAMYLIVQQRSNAGAPLPDVLPPNLIPPSMRQQKQFTSSAAVQPLSPFDPVPPPAPPAQKSAADDLFGLDSFSGAQAQTGPAPTQSAGPFDGSDVFSTPKEASPAMSPAAQSPVPPQGASVFGRPVPQFVPTSNFGQSILPSSTGGSGSGSLATGVQQNKGDMDDLLGDADPEVSKKLTNETTELANLSNQIGSLTKQTQELKAKRASAEQDLSSLTTQKQHIEAQLNQLRAAYEKEAAQVRRVEDQLAASRSETIKATQEYQKIEAEYNQLQYKKQEVSSQLEADRRENENLKERMNVINAENRTLREELERLQSQARREKGLTSINKKQVSQSESEREKLKSQMDDARAAINSSPAPPGSPTLSQGSTSYKNPFHRKSPPVAENVFGPSPFGPAKSGSMDDVFGPSFNASSVFAQKPPTDMSATASAPSASEGGHGEVSTPPTSPPASSYHESPQPGAAPPPTTENQMTSNFLPLQVTRADSTTSSVQVNPSVSIRGDEFSRPDTPTNWMGSTTSDAPKEIPRKLDDRRSSFSVRSDPGTESVSKAAFNRGEASRSPFALERNSTGPAAGPSEDKPSLQKNDSFGNFSPPGSFPSFESSTLIKPTPTGESNMSNRSKASNASKSFDPFGGLKDETRSNASKSDFDEVFKQSFGPLPRVTENNTGGSGSAKPSFHEEFPPIEEVRADSDSDSDGGGFEDNFTSNSPQRTHASLAKPQPIPESSTIPPPSAAAQQPPPTYSQATSAQEKAGFPAEYSSLLPSRSDPMRHDAPTPGGSTNAITFPTTKDEFDDEFSGLADAKEADDKSTDNDFGTPNAFDEFDPVFDAPKKSGPAPGTAIGDENEFTQFSFNIEQNPAPAPQHARSPSESPVMTNVKPATSQDWDAIFADFGNNSNQEATTKDTSSASAVAAASGNNPPANGSSITTNDPADSGGVSLTADNSNPPDSAAEKDEKISKIAAMGFDRDSSVKALEKNGWNIDRVSR